MNRPSGEKISVCLLSYNHEEVIESTLESILDQTLGGYEIIVSDDCSTDGTFVRICEMAARDKRIRPIQTPQNMGMSANANFAVSQSSRPYIALLHHDDLYRKDLLEKWLDVIEAHPDVAFVFNPYGVYQSDYIYSSPIPAGRVDGRWLLETYLFPRWGCVVRGTAMIRRAAWEEVGGMREQFGLLADVDLWMRLSMRWAAGYVDEPVITVRHQRPNYYPDIYTGATNKSFWKRQRLLYKIHAANRLDYYDFRSFADWFSWSRFRVRLSLETAKWLVYAVIRRKFIMIATSTDSVTDYDLAPLRLMRGIMRRTLGRRAVEKA